METQPQDHSTTTAPFVGNIEQFGSHVQPSSDLAANDILQRIDMLIGETAYLRESVGALAMIKGTGPGDPHSPGDIGTQAKATAIASVIEHRERTNQQLIALLNRMYDDVSPTTVKKPSRSAEETKLIERLVDKSPEMSDDTLRAFLESLA